MRYKGSLKRCLNGSYSESDLKNVIHLSHSYAAAYLRMKAAADKVYAFHGENLEDLAWDFIADIFERDSEGYFTALNDYFDSDVTELPENEIRVLLRRYIFTKVEDNIFRAAGEKDPSLKKIIRNLKLAVKDQPAADYKNGHIVAGNCLDAKLPLMPSEILQGYITAKIGSTHQIPEILGEVINILNLQTEYQKKVSLIGLSIIIRSVFVDFNHTLVKDKVQPVAEQNLLYGEFHSFIDRSTRKIHFKVGYKYLHKKKTTPRMLEAYSAAAKNIVTENFTEPYEDTSQFEYLKKEIPDLDYDEYRSKHRQILEYFVKLIRADVIKVYEKEWA